MSDRPDTLPSDPPLPGPVAPAARDRLAAALKANMARRKAQARARAAAGDAEPPDAPTTDVR